MALALDSSTPAIVRGTSNPATTAQFSPPAETVLFALCAGDDGNTFSLAGGGLDWAEVGHYNVTNVCGLGVFWAYNADAQTNITVASTRIGSWTANSLRVLVITGAETTFGGANSGASAVTRSITTTRANSWVWAVLGDEAGGTGFAAATDCTLDAAFAAYGGVSGGTVKRTTTTAASGTAVTVGITGGPGAPSIYAFEIREPVVTGPPPKTGLGAGAGAGLGVQDVAHPATPTRVGLGASTAVAAGPARIAVMLYAGATTAVSGSWVDSANAVGSTTGDYATWTDTGSASEATLELSGFAAQSAVPSGAALDTVLFTVRHGESSALALMGDLVAQVYLGATPHGDPVPLPLSETVREDTLTVADLAYADLADLRVRVTATRT